MDIEELRQYCLAKEDVAEGLPFGPGVLVFKVAGNIFLLLPLDSVPVQFNVKCDAEKAVDLREQYSSVIPGYHMNKKYWNTVIIDGSIPSKLLQEFIDESYQLVRQGAKKKQKLK